MKTKLLRCSTLVILLLTLSNCRKDIDVPDPSLEKCFGDWEWIATTDGFSGQIRTPQTEGYTKWVNFSKKGIKTSYVNDKKDAREKFHFDYGFSHFSSNDVYMIQIESKGINKKEQLPESITFFGNDTLQLQVECLDCPTYRYVRK